MRIYIAGPMRGRKDFNFPEFLKVEALLRMAGNEVFNPAEGELEGGFEPWGLEGTDEELEAIGFDMRETMARDLTCILRECDAIYMLPEWWDSTGAILELMTAKMVGLEVINVQPGDYDKALETIRTRYFE